MPGRGAHARGLHHQCWCRAGIQVALTPPPPPLRPLAARPPHPQTNEAFWNSVSHAKPLAVGLNCALGATDMKKYIANLSACADCFVFCYPHAGLPNAMGGYDQKGPEMAEEIRPFCEDGIVNAIGGCCGTGWCGECWSGLCA